MDRTVLVTLSLTYIHQPMEFVASLLSSNKEIVLNPFKEEKC